jgi:hypothetical protein
MAGSLVVRTGLIRIGILDRHVHLAALLEAMKC